jgi:hypothetical protein
MEYYSKCIKCHEVKPVMDFRNRKGTEFKRCGECRVQARNYQRERKENKELVAKPTYEEIKERLQSMEMILNSTLTDMAVLVETM